MFSYAYMMSMPIRTITAALAAVVLCWSCQQEATPQAQEYELTLKAVSMTMTKGYVTSTGLSDTTPTSLHGTPSTSYRDIYLTAWHHSQKNGEKEYFRMQRYERNAGTATDNLWHRADPLYWPLDGTLDLMAYSCTNAFPESSVDYSPGVSTDRLLLSVDRTYTQDDILFSYVGNAGRSTEFYSTVPMQFKHGQAWIEIVFHTPSSAYNNIIKVNRVELRDIYTSGQLIVEHPYGEAEGAWSFRFAERHDTDVDDVNGIYGQYVTTSRVYLDMLLPEQPKKDMVIYYTMEGGDPEMLYVYHMQGLSTWQMGKKYVYDITLSPTTIEVNSSVSDWDGEYRTYIPQEYRSLEYVTVEPWHKVTTGYPADETSVIEAKVCCFANAVDSVGYLWMSGSTAIETRVAAFVRGGNIGTNWRFCGKTPSPVVKFTMGEVHRLRQDITGVYVDGEQIATYTDVPHLITPQNMFFGLWDIDGREGASDGASVRWYGFSHTLGGNTVTDMVPVVRVSDGKAGFWDLVTKTFHACGTAGPAIVE